ncbi:MAG: ribonuclease III domain-containing protein [Cyanobacteria bacterium J06636_16]
MTQSTYEDSQSGGYSAEFLAAMLKQAIAVSLSNAHLQSLSPVALAYIGDAVYELFVRSHHLVPPKRIQDYHHQVVHHVRAEQQAQYSELLKPHLTETEIDIMRRGRNAAPSRKQRASAHDYQQATGLEALVGYLYLTDPQRLLEILSHLPLDPVELG